MSPRDVASAARMSPRDPFEPLEAYIDRLCADFGHTMAGGSGDRPVEAQHEFAGQGLQMRLPPRLPGRTMSYARLHGNIDELVDFVMDIILSDTVDSLELEERSRGPPPEYFALKDAEAEMVRVDTAEQLLRDKYSDADRVPAKARRDIAPPPARAPTAPRRKRVPVGAELIMKLEEARTRFREDQILREADLAGHQFASWVIFDSLAEQITADILQDVLGVGDLAEALHSLVQDLIEKELELPA